MNPPDDRTPRPSTHARMAARVTSSPPLALLCGAVERLERGGVTVALGGSGLLAALGLVETVGDWDLTTDDPFGRVAAALAGEPYTDHGSDDLHADRKLVLADGAVELILGLAFHVAGGVVRIPTMVSARVEGIPLGSPECWAVAYDLLGRREKSAALFDHLARVGADRRTVTRLLGEPLPAALAAGLAALATSRET